MSPDKTILFVASSGTYKIKNGFSNAFAKCEGKYEENEPIISPGLTSSVPISATVSCSATLNTKTFNCTSYYGAIQDLVIDPSQTGDSCAVDSADNTTAGSFNITNKITLPTLPR